MDMFHFVNLSTNSELSGRKIDLENSIYLCVQCYPDLHYSHGDLKYRCDYEANQE